MGKVGALVQETERLTHDGGDREADAHLALEASDDVLGLQPLARHQHLFWSSEQHRRRPDREKWHQTEGAGHSHDEHTGFAALLLPLRHLC